jgi:N-dimethylarginine dimethylaminohydrolase
MKNIGFKKFIAEKRDDLEGGLEDNQKFIMPSDLDIPVFLMCPPFSLDSSNPNNALMKSMPPEKRKTNVLKAVDQFLAIYQFVSCHAMIYLLPSRKGLGDLPYVANLGINLPHIHDNTIVVANYKSDPRRGETPVGVEFFNGLGYNTVVSPPYFEGEADLKFLNKNNYCGSYGERTSMNALNWFASSYDMNIIPVKMIDEKCYHLDCVMFPLESYKLVAVTDLIDKPTLKKIEKFTEIIPVDKRCGHGGITNCVRMGNVIMNGTTIESEKIGTDSYDMEKNKNNVLEKLCAQNGYDVVFFDISEFDKSGAALSCMFMHLNYPEFNDAPR